MDRRPSCDTGWAAARPVRASGSLRGQASLLVWLSRCRRAGADRCCSGWALVRAWRRVGLAPPPRPAAPSCVCGRVSVGRVQAPSAPRASGPWARVPEGKPLTPLCSPVPFPWHWPQGRRPPSTSSLWSLRIQGHLEPQAGGQGRERPHTGAGWRPRASCSVAVPPLGGRRRPLPENGYRAVSQPPSRTRGTGRVLIFHRPLAGPETAVSLRRSPASDTGPGRGSSRQGRGNALQVTAGARAQSSPRSSSSTEPVRCLWPSGDRGSGVDGTASRWFARGDHMVVRGRSLREGGRGLGAYKGRVFLLHVFTEGAGVAAAVLRAGQGLGSPGLSPPSHVPRWRRAWQGRDLANVVSREAQGTCPPARTTLHVTGQPLWQRSAERDLGALGAGAGWPPAHTPPGRRAPWLWFLRDGPPLVHQPPLQVSSVPAGPPPRRGPPCFLVGCPRD